MRRLSKKQIIIILVVAITIVALALVGVLYCIHNGKDKETVKEDDKIESVEDDKTDEDKEKETEKDTTSVVEDESEENTSQSEVQTPEVEEPAQQTTQQQGSSNSNQNLNNNNGNNNSGGGTTTPSNPTPVPTPTPEPEKSPYAGMYSQLDAAAKERYSKCVDIFRTGMGSQYIPVRDYGTSTHYWGETIGVCNHTTTGSWMMVTIKGWSGYGIGAETEPIYAEVPTLVKQCLETIAPQGGTELYNTVNSIISQYGSPYDVPTLGAISESIPGLSVTIENVKGVFIMQFWPE